MVSLNTDPDSDSSHFLYRSGSREIIWIPQIRIRHTALTPQVATTHLMSRVLSPDSPWSESLSAPQQLLHRDPIFTLKDKSWFRPLEDNLAVKSDKNHSLPAFQQSSSSFFFKKQAQSPSRILHKKRLFHTVLTSNTVL